MGSMVFPKREIVDRIRNEYPSGSRVKLLHMDDPYTKIPVGAKGTVSSVDDTGTIFVDWDMGSHLGVVYGEDSCQKLNTVKTICYGKEDIFDSREEAIDFYLQAVAGSEGSEQDRYQHILLDLTTGKSVCTDGVD